MTGHADLVAYARGTLSPEASARVAEHLEHCASCRAGLAATREVLAALRVCPPPLDTARYRAQVHARIRARTSRSSRRRAWGPMALATAAGLAALALVAGLQLGGPPVEGDLAMLEPLIGDQLPLLEEYRIVERLDLLEDLDVIRRLDELPPDAS